MLKFATLSAVYYAAVKVVYTICAAYIGWVFPGFMAGWYDLNHGVIRSIPNWGVGLDNVIRDNFSDGSLVFWELWFGIGIIAALVRFAIRHTTTRTVTPVRHR